MAGIKGIM